MRTIRTFRNEEEDEDCDVFIIVELTGKDMLGSMGNGKKAIVKNILGDTAYNILYPFIDLFKDLYKHSYDTSYYDEHDIFPQTELDKELNETKQIYEIGIYFECE